MLSWAGSLEQAQEASSFFLCSGEKSRDLIRAVGSGDCRQRQDRHAQRRTRMHALALAVHSMSTLLMSSHTTFKHKQK